MAIRKRRGTWFGDDAADIDAYLAFYSEDEHPIEVVRHATCTCGTTTFTVTLDDEEGFAERRCTACRAAHLMIDSEDSAEDAEPGQATCPCNGEIFEVAAGFAFYLEPREPKWVYVGLRCVACGLLGCYTSWAIDYSPANQLLDRV